MFGKPILAKLLLASAYLVPMVCTTGLDTARMEFKFSIPPSEHYSTVNTEIMVPQDMFVTKIVSPGAFDSHGRMVPLHLDVDDHDPSLPMVHHHVGVHLKSTMGIDFHDQNKMFYMFHANKTRTFPEPYGILLTKGTTLIGCASAINRYPDTQVMTVNFDLTFLSIRKENRATASARAVTLLDLTSFPDHCEDGERRLSVQEEFFFPPYQYSSKFDWVPNHNHSEVAARKMTIVTGFFHLHLPYKRVQIIDPTDGTVVFDTTGRGDQMYVNPPPHAVTDAKFLLRYEVDCSQLTRHDVLALTIGITTQDPAVQNHVAVLFNPTFAAGSFRGGEAAFWQEHSWQEWQEAYTLRAARIQAELVAGENRNTRPDGTPINTRPDGTLVVVVVVGLLAGTVLACFVWRSCFSEPKSQRKFQQAHDEGQDLLTDVDDCQGELSEGEGDEERTSGSIGGSSSSRC